MLHDSVGGKLDQAGLYYQVLTELETVYFPSREITIVVSQDSSAGNSYSAEVALTYPSVYGGGTFTYDTILNEITSSTKLFDQVAGELQYNSLYPRF